MQIKHFLCKSQTPTGKLQKFTKSKHYYSSSLIDTCHDCFNHWNKLHMQVTRH